MGKLYRRGNSHLTHEHIGRTYTGTRSPDPRLGKQIHAALGNATSVLNVGAGTGSYVPEDRHVVAVEPSETMIAQRHSGSTSVVRGLAECLPFREKSFDAVMAILTLHHWRNQKAGLEELRRVARHRIVIFTFDPAKSDTFWLIRDYLPANKALDEKSFPDPLFYRSIFQKTDVIEVPIPADCRDGFLCAYWKRPEAYLSPAVQAGISSFAALPPDEVSAGINALTQDLKTGEWARRNRDLKDLSEKDYGYRLIIAELT